MGLTPQAGRLVARVACVDDHLVRIPLRSAVAVDLRVGYLLDKVYLPVGSVINEETMAADFDIDAVKGHGIAGWEVVGVVPRTLGTSLTNRSMGSTMGQTWGGGMGGNVVGVYLLFRFALSEATFDASRGTLDTCVGAEAKRLVE